MTGEILVSPAVDIQIVFGADGGRSFSMRFAPLPLDTSRKDLDATLDLVMSAVERQRAKYELVDEEHLLAAQMERIRKFESMSISLEESSRSWWEVEGRKGEWSLKEMSPQARNEREKLQISLQGERHDATARQAKIRRLQKVVDSDGSDIGPDRNAGVPDR